MKKKAALAVCSVLAASFTAAALSNSYAQAKGRATLNMTPELAAKMNETAATESSSAEEEDTAAAEGTTDPDSADAASTDEEKSGLRRAEEAAAAEDETAEEDDDSIRERTDYFSIRVPSDWEDHYVTEEGKAAEGIPSLSFYEKTAHDQQEGGLLFSIGLHTDRENYLSLPNYVFLGELTADDGTVYAAVAELPSDVQFAMEAREQYESMAAQIPSVLQTLQAADGMTFHAGQSRLEQNAQLSYAFASILDQFRGSGALPNGTIIDVSDAASYTNQYAILDVDGDGVDELVLRIASKALSSKISGAQDGDAIAEGDSQYGNDLSAEDEYADGVIEETEETAPGADDSTAAVTQDALGNPFGFSSGSTDTEGRTQENSSASADADSAEEAGTVQNGPAENDQIAADTENAAEDNTETAAADQAAADAENADAVAEDDYYDAFANSNYYIFTGNSETDSHAAHLTEEDLEEALKDSSEPYVSTAYDIGWQDISKGNVNSLYHTAYTPVGVSPAHENAARRHAYKEALANIVDHNELPDGSQAISYVDYTSEDMEENNFAIADVDADGVDELLVQLNNTAADSQRELIYGYDADKDELVLEFTGVPDGVTLYESGALKSEAQYNNNEPSRLWPYALYSYNEETGTYESRGSVYAWDEDVMREQTGRTVDALSEGFDKAADKDGNGRIYFLEKPEDADAEITEDSVKEGAPAAGTSAGAVDDADVSEWFADVVGQNSSRLDPYWVSLTDDNIGSMLTK